MEKVKKVEYGECIFVLMYENRRMKPFEIVLRRGE
jgi:hypothetical protein